MANLSKLKARMEKDRHRVLRLMEVRRMEEVLKDGPDWWPMAVAWPGGEMSEVVDNTDDADDTEAAKSKAGQDDVTKDTTPSQGAKTVKLGARHPIITPNTRVTNHSTWPEHLTGLVGWWRRVEQEGKREGIARMKTSKMAEERERRQSSKLSFVRKFFPDTKLTPGGTCKLRGRDRDTHLLTDVNSTISSMDRNDENVQPPNTSTLTKIPKRRILFYDSNIFSPSKSAKFSENLNFWRQTEEIESGDSAGPIIQTTHGQEGDNGSGGSLIVLEQYKKKAEGPQ